MIESLLGGDIWVFTFVIYSVHDGDVTLVLRPGFVSFLLVAGGSISSSSDAPSSISSYIKIPPLLKFICALEL